MKRFENNHVYISRKKYTEYKDLIFKTEELYKYRPLLEPLAVDYNNDDSMCYCKILSEGISEDYIKELDKLGVMWIIKLIYYFDNKKYNKYCRKHKLKRIL